MQTTPFLCVAANQGHELASVELDDEQDEALHRDRAAELRVKFHVPVDMHGRAQQDSPDHRGWKSQEVGHGLTGRPPNPFSFE